VTATSTRRVRVPVPGEHILGDPDAPVTLIEYGDFECPYCAAAAPVLHRLIEESDGRVRLLYRHFPLADRHPYALTAALAAEAAGAQGAFWPMHDLLFTNQDRLDDAALRAYADDLGLDSGTITGEAAQPFGDKVEADFEAGLRAGVQGTPSLLIDGRLFPGRVEIGALRREVGMNGAVRSGPYRRLQPRSRWQRWRPFGGRRAEGEPLPENPQQDDPGDRCGQ